MGTSGLLLCWTVMELMGRSALFSAIHLAFNDFYKTFSHFICSLCFLSFKAFPIHTASWSREGKADEPADISTITRATPCPLERSRTHCGLRQMVLAAPPSEVRHFAPSNSSHGQFRANQIPVVPGFITPDMVSCWSIGCSTTGWQYWLSEHVILVQSMLCLVVTLG